MHPLLSLPVKLQLNYKKNWLPRRLGALNDTFANRLSSVKLPKTNLPYRVGKRQKLN